MTDHPLRPATRLCLGRPLPYQQADGTQAPPQALAFMKRPAFLHSTCVLRVLRGISFSFERLSPAQGQIAYVLLTRAPLYSGRSPFSHDLHVLGAPLTFALSQDQTLHLRLNPELCISNMSTCGFLRVRSFISNYWIKKRMVFYFSDSVFKERVPRDPRERSSSILLMVVKFYM